MKKPISATIDVELIKWLDYILKNDNSFRNKSHAIEFAIEEFRSKLEKDKVAEKKTEKNNKKR